MPEDDLLAAWDRAGQAAGGTGGAEPAESEAAEDATPAAEQEPSNGARNAKGQFQKKVANGATPKVPTAKSADSAAKPAPAAADPSVEAPAGTRASSVGTAEGTNAGLEGASLAEFHELAKKHGFEIDGNRVTVRERAQFREQRSRFVAEKQQALQEIEQTRQQHLGEAARIGQAAIRAQQALETGDFDAFAQAIGRKDWNDLNREAIGRFADPNYKRVQELEQWKRTQEEQAQRSQREQQLHAERQHQATIEQSYQAELSRSMAASTDPLVAAMADDPVFVGTIFKIQKAHFDGNSTISPEEAVRLKPAQGGSPLIETLKQVHSRLSKAFRAGQSEHETTGNGGGPREAQIPEPAKAGGGREAPIPVRTSKPSTSIPQRKTTEAASPGKFRTDKEWLDSATARLAHAVQDDIKAGR